MEQLTDLKAILHSKRANIYYLEKCRVMQKDGRVLYLTEEKNQNLYWNIPIANTTVILLGTGTSITQAAVRMLASAGVLIGFSGGGCTPLLVASEIEWLSPQSEYRPTEYIQGWLSFWFNESARLKVAKQFQKLSLSYIKNVWSSDRELRTEGFVSDDTFISGILDSFQNRFDACENVSKLLLAEVLFTKNLYKLAFSKTNQAGFVRDNGGTDVANGLLKLKVY